MVDDAFAGAGAPDSNPNALPVGLGMAAPTILAHGTSEQLELIPAAAIDGRRGVVPTLQ